MAENDQEIDIPVSETTPETRPANPVTSGLSEGALETFLNYASVPAALESVAEYPINKALDLPVHGTGFPMVDEFLKPVMNQNPVFQKMSETPQLQPHEVLLNNRLTKALQAGVKANQYVEKYYKNDTLISLASQAGEAMKNVFEQNKGLAATSPAEFMYTAAQGIATNAWHRFADYTANRIAYHSSKMAIPAILGAFVTPEVAFGAESAGRNVRELAGKPISPAQKSEALMQKVAADAFFAHYFYAVPGIAKKLTPWSESLMSDMGKSAGPVILQGIKNALSEGIASATAKKAAQNLINGAANQLLNILVDQHYKLKDWTLSQAVGAIAEAGLLASAISVIINTPLHAFGKAQLVNKLPTYEELRGQKMVIEAWINGMGTTTPPHIGTEEMVKRMVNVDYMLKNELYRDSDRAYSSLNQMISMLQDQRGFVENTGRANLIKYGGFSDAELKEQGVSQKEIDKVRGAEAKNLKIKMKAEEQASKYGYKQGWKEASDEIKQIIGNAKQDVKESKYQGRWREAEQNTARDMVFKYLKEYAPKEVQSKFLSAIRDAKDPKGLAKVFGRIDAAVENFNKSSMIRMLKTKIDRIASSGKIAIEYKQKIGELLEGFSFTQPTSERLARLNDLQKYVNEQEAAGNDISVPQYLTDSLDILSQKSLSAMTFGEIKNIFDKVELMEKLGETKLWARKTLYEAEKQQKLDIITGSDLNKLNFNEVEKANGVGAKKPGMLDRLLDSMSNAKEYMRLLHKTMWPMQHLFDWFGESLTRTFKTPVDQAWGRFQEKVNALHDEVMTKIKDLNLTEESLERIGVYGALMQEGGRKKLLNNYTEKALREFETKGLTPEEKKFYDFMRKELDTARPQLERFMRDVHNAPLGKVANYFPFHTDWSLLTNAEIQDRLKQLPEYDIQKKNVNLKMTKARTDTKGVQKIRVDAADVFLNHMENVYYALEMGKTVKQLQEIAGTEDFRNAVGDMGQHMMREWVDLIARKGGPRGGDMNNAWRTINKLRKNIGVSMLGFNPATILIHVLPVVQGSGVIGHWAFRGYGEVSKNPEWRAFVMENSPEVRNRLGGDDPAYREFGNTWWENLQNASLKPITKVNGHSAAGVWAGAYMKWSAENGRPIDIKAPEADGIAYAEQVVKQTQSSGMAKDAPLLLSRGLGVADSRNLAKLLFQFSTPMFYRYGLVSEMAPELWRAGEHAKAAGIVVSQLANALGELMIRHGTKVALGTIGALLFGEAQKKGKETPMWSEYIHDLLKTYPLFPMVMDSIDYGTMPGALLSEISSTLDSAKNVRNAHQLETKLKWAAITGVKAASILVGIPQGRRAASAISRHWQIPTGGGGGGSKDKNFNLDIGLDAMDREWKKFQKESGF